jgi:hypothetical protein
MTRPDSKIGRYEVDKKVIQLLKYNLSCREVADRINMILDDPTKTINVDDVERWLMDQSQELKDEIKQAQFNRLSGQVFNMERNAVKIREDAMKDIEVLADELMEDRDNLSPKDKKDLSNIIMKKIYIQESAEKLAGVGTGRRNYGDVNVNINVGVMDRMKELTKNKDKIIDVEVEEVKDNTKKKRKKRGGSGT